MKTREIEYRSYYNEASFLQALEFIKGLVSDYNYYFSGFPNEINDLEKVIKKKQDRENHKVCVYYNLNGVYAVGYCSHRIIAIVYQNNAKNSGFAHKVVREVLDSVRRVDEEEGTPGEVCLF